MNDLVYDECLATYEFSSESHKIALFAVNSNAIFVLH